MESRKAKMGFVNLAALRLIKLYIHYLGIDETIRLLKKTDADGAYIDLVRDWETVPA